MVHHISSCSVNLGCTTGSVVPVDIYLSKVSKITLEQCPSRHCSNVILLTWTGNCRLGLLCYRLNKKQFIFLHGTLITLILKCFYFVFITTPIFKCKEINLSLDIVMLGRIGLKGIFIFSNNFDANLHVHSATTPLSCVILSRNVLPEF